MIAMKHHAGYPYYGLLLLGLLVQNCGKIKVSHALMMEEGSPNQTGSYEHHSDEEILRMIASERLKQEQLQKENEILRQQRKKLAVDSHITPTLDQSSLGIGLPNEAEDEAKPSVYEVLLQKFEHEREARERFEKENDIMREQQQKLTAEREAYQKDYELLQKAYATLQSNFKKIKRQLQESKQHTDSLTCELSKLKIDMQSQSDVMGRWAVSKGAFGKASWGQYFGDVGVEPLLPDDIDKIWNSNCPFWPDKKVGDTHLLVLIPATVNGSPFTLNLLEELVSSPPITTRSYATRYRLYNHKVQKAYGDSAPGRSYWILMTKEILPSSRDKDYVAQQRLVADYAREHKLGYTLPSVLEATTAVLTHYVRSGKQLYTNDPSTYTRCFEQIDGPYPVAIGGFSDEGLHIRHEYDEASVDIGASCLQKIY
ncbi:MAG: hypothetical protein ACX93T_03905 [Bacteroidota bacterium]